MAQTQPRSAAAKSHYQPAAYLAVEQLVQTSCETLPTCNHWLVSLSKLNQKSQQKVTQNCLPAKSFLKFLKAGHSEEKALCSWCPFTPGKHQAASYTPSSRLLQTTCKTCRNEPKWLKPFCWDASQQQLLYLQSPFEKPVLLHASQRGRRCRARCWNSSSVGTAAGLTPLRLLLFYFMSYHSSQPAQTLQAKSIKLPPSLSWSEGLLSLQAIWNGFSPVLQHFSNCIWESHQ